MESIDMKETVVLTHREIQPVESKCKFAKSKLVLIGSLILNVLLLSSVFSSLFSSKSCTSTNTGYISKAVEFAPEMIQFYGDAACTKPVFAFPKDSCSQAPNGDYITAVCKEGTLVGTDYAFDNTCKLPSASVIATASGKGCRLVESKSKMGPYYVNYDC
ncbi:hypothetical protein BC833DRAFT_597685 [Globomyces pollinis-pini]|nr:hypothetical protein BC833DRAFT_597685 [Globomyces pollinis-pini]